MSKKRILSGMRPTGKLHLGNYMGALKNWKTLQKEYECFFFVADWHALTTDYDNTKNISKDSEEMVIDWLSAGLDHQKSTIFVQSGVREHAELFLLLSMITPLPWLERCPTYKEQQEQIQKKDLSTYGFLGYPLLQAADIMMYRADGVPVGQDQLPHIEMTREIVRRFNHLYKKVFPEPESLMTSYPKLLGTDGRKMSKSYDNCIYLSDIPKVIIKKISGMLTDPQRKKRTDPGDPGICPLFSLHKIFSDIENIEMIDAECRKAGIGCVDCKRMMSQKLIDFLTPLHERRAYYLDHKAEVREILNEGNKKARQNAKKTMELVRKAIGV